MMPTWSQDGGGNAIHTMLILPKKSHCPIGYLIEATISEFMGLPHFVMIGFDSGFVSGFDSTFGVKMVVLMQSTLLILQKKLFLSIYLVMIRNLRWFD